MHMNALCHFNTIQLIYQICIYYQINTHPTCYSNLSTITQISSLEQITISSPMAYTHNYIPYNCDIMLTPQAYALTYLFPLNSSHSFQPISYTPHMDLFGPIHTNPGLFLTVPKQSKWAVRGQLTHQTFVPLFETDFHGHFRPHTHQHTIYCINYETTTQNSPYIVTDCPNGFKKFPYFGPKFWDRSNSHSRPQTTQSSTKHLNKV